MSLRAQFDSWRPDAEAIRVFKEQVIVIESAAEERATALRRP